MSTEAAHAHAHVHHEKDALAFEVFPEEGISVHLLESAIREIHAAGVRWAEKFIIEEVAFGIHKLKVGCVITDGAVTADDIMEKVAAIHIPGGHKAVKSVSFSAINSIDA